MRCICTLVRRLLPERLTSEALESIRPITAAHCVDSACGPKYTPKYFALPSTSMSTESGTVSCRRRRASAIVPLPSQTITD